MKIKMTQTTLGSEDGIKVMQYQKGKEYEINTNLVDMFLEMGVCVKVEPEVEMKKVDVPSNKMVEPDSNKSVKEDKKKRKKIKDLK